jgi:hypothetical protein
VHGRPLLHLYAFNHILESTPRFGKGPIGD